MLLAIPEKESIGTLPTRSVHRLYDLEFRIKPRERVDGGRARQRPFSSATK